jgi:hypothetical protein
MTANGTWRDSAEQVDARSALAMTPKQRVSSVAQDNLRLALAVSRDNLVRERVDLLAQIRALSRQLESIDRELDHIAHAEAAYTQK